MSRPPFQPTEDQKSQVAIAAGGGWTHEEIAIALGIDRKTLEKHFEHELSHGAYAKRLEVISAMHGLAVKGNVAAQKAYLQLEPTLAAPPAEKPEPKGKKEQAADDAKTATKGTAWHELLPAKGSDKTLQ